MRGIMMGFLFVLLTLPPLGAPLMAQGGPSVAVRSAVAAAVDEEVAAIVPGPLLQSSKATYLEGYGVVVTVEVALERPRTPFDSARAPDEVRRSTEMRRSRLREMAVDLLRRRVATIEGLGPDEHLAIVIYMLNTNPADVPDQPAQLVVSAKRRDVADFGLTAAFADHVTIREY